MNLMANRMYDSEEMVLQMNHNDVLGGILKKSEKMSPSYRCYNYTPFTTFASYCCNVNLANRMHDSEEMVLQMNHYQALSGIFARRD